MINLPETKNLKWELDDIVPLQKFEELEKDVLDKISKFHKYFDLLKPSLSTAKFKEFIKFSESLAVNLNRLYYRASLMEAINQKSEKARMLKEKAKSLDLKVMDASISIWHWLKGKEVAGKKSLDDKNAKRLFNSAGDLEYILTHQRKLAQHTLSEKEENIIANKDSSGISIITELRTLIETEFEYFFKPKGCKKGKWLKNQSELTAFIHSHKKNYRKTAYKALLEKYRDNIDKFYIMYRSVVKDFVYEAKLRGYASPISVRNKSNHISDSVIKTLISVCRKNRYIFQNYFKFKAKCLNLKKLTRFDIYAPLSKNTANITISEAIDTVMDSFSGFSTEFSKKAKEILNKRHIDFLPSPIKSAGAFCATPAPEIIPYIMLNYTGTHRDILTLAHELGHGIHSLYASSHSITCQSASLPLAETASTFCEMLVFDNFYTNIKSQNLKKKLLSDKIAESYATILRQNYFIIFEQEVHKKIEKGMTAEKISDMYFDNLKEQFGDSIDIDPLFRYEWAHIPHIVNYPFYCYAYNFGELLSLSLFSEYKRTGKKFIPKLEKILSYGGSAEPAKILSEVGININSRKFWQQGFDIILGWQKELEKLCLKK